MGTFLYVKRASPKWSTSFDILQVFIIWQAILVVETEVIQISMKGKNIKN
jgi:hypothetical protein